MQRGDGIEDRVFAELGQCQEIIALITPWAADRNWLWVEIGAARFAGMRIVAVLYGTTLEEIDRLKGGKTFLKAKYVVEIHEMDAYLSEVRARAAL